MHLIIDLGNTTEKAALFSGEELLQVYKSAKLNEDILLEIINNHPINAWIISSVTNALTQFTSVLHKISTGIEFNHTTPIPIENLYTTPETLGKDRLANAIGAWKLFPGKNILVIDAGSCIKYDVLSHTGKYIGGGISPGLAMRFDAMHHFTAKLPKIKSDRYAIPNKLLLPGESTEAALICGGAMGAIKEVEGFINDYKKKYNDLIVILTGGDLSFFDYHLKIKIFALPDLTLIGLNTVLEFNSKN
ncbi:MAG TPA: type III pantothenate kinase [Chitinophagales bacterium]|nr:type III pantothenate kinase [Chitinophagales bacterium]